MTRLRIQMPCQECKNQPQDQPNYCRQCGGSGRLSKIVSPLELQFMSDIPEVLGASVVITANRRKRRRRTVGVR